MEPTWVLSAPDGPHVGPMNLAIRGITSPRVQWVKHLFSIVTSRECYGAWNHWQVDYLFKDLIRLVRAETAHIHIMSHCEGKRPVIGGFPSLIKKRILTHIRPDGLLVINVCYYSHFFVSLNKLLNKQTSICCSCDVFKCKNIYIQQLRDFVSFHIKCVIVYQTEAQIPWIFMELNLHIYIFGKLIDSRVLVNKWHTIK